MDIDPQRTISALSNVTGLNGDTIATAILKSGLKRDFDAGEIDRAGFHAASCRALNCEIPFDVFENAWGSWVAPLPQTEELLQRLADRHRLFLLSNTDPIHLEASRAFGRTWFELFEDLHLSYEARLLKPDPEFFVSAIRRFNLVPSQCVFLDDMPENVAAAAGAGITAHRVRTRGLEEAKLAQWGLLRYYSTTKKSR